MKGVLAMSQSPAQIVVTSPFEGARMRAADQEIRRRNNLHAISTLRKLAQGHFWRKPDNAQYVSDRASELARVLLFFIQPIADDDDVQNLIEGLVGGPSNYNRAGAQEHTQWAADLVSRSLTQFSRTGVAFEGDAHTSRETKLRGFGMAIRQLSPGFDQGAEENHLVVATTTYLRVLHYTEGAAVVLG